MFAYFFARQSSRFCVNQKIITNCRMNSMGMTTYMYAPKHDAKHRAFWRDLYSVEEAGKYTE